MLSRRELLQRGATVAGGALALGRMPNALAAIMNGRQYPSAQALKPTHFGELSKKPASSGASRPG